jgi:hypothetical protein
MYGETIQTHTWEGEALAEREGDMVRQSLALPLYR